NPEALNLEADEKNVNDVHTAFYALHADVRNLMATVEKVAVDTLKSAMDDLASDRDSGIFLDEFEDVLKLTVEPGENGVAIGNGNRIGLAKAAYFDGLSNPAKLLVIAVYPDVETLFDALLSRIEVLKDIASCEEFLKDYGYLFLRNAGSVDGDDQEDIEYAIAAYQILREGAQELVSAQAEEEGIEDVETFFNALLTAAAFKAAHTLLLSDLFDQYDGYNASDYFEDREEERNIWQDLVTIYDNAVIAINALTTLEAVDNYRRDVYQSVLNDMQGVKSKAWYNGAFIEIAEAEINALAASDPYRWENNYSKNDGGADRWAELQALFTNALESLSGKDTQGEIDDVVAGVRTAAADVPTLPALSADLNVQFSFSSTSFLPGTSGTTGVNPRNTAGFFGNLGDAVDFMLVKFYGEELDAETLTYGSSKVFAEYKFTWETTTSTATPPVTTGYLYAQKWENGAAVGNRVQVLSQTASIYIASATFMRTVLGDDFCTQNILTGAGVIVGKIKNIQLTATLITPVASAYGNSAEGPKKSNTSGSGAPAFGGTHPEIVAASSDFDKLVEDIGTLAYTQTKLDLLTAAEDALDGFRAAQLKFVNLLTLEALLQAREDFDGLEDAAVEAFISLVPSQSTIDTMSPSSSGEDIEAFVDAVGEALGRYGLLLESTLLEHERASEIPAAYARLLAAQTKAGTLGSAADLAASELKGLILAANLQTGPARPNTVEYARKIAPLAADLAALKNVEGAAPAIGKIATEVALLEDNIDWFTHQGSYAASGGYVKAPINLPNTNATWGGGNNVNWNISAGNDRMIVDGLYTADFRDNVEKINSILLIRMWFYDVDQNPVLVNGQQAYIDFDFYGYRTTGGTVGGQRVGWSDNNATGTAAWRVWATDINYAFGQKYPGVTLRGYNVTTAPNEGWHFRLQFVAKEYCAIGEIDYYYYANSGMDAMSAKQTKTVP
ncbi:MAG: hypothetical protein FWD58_09470, partial [Firmicutes bacterium]|nr:hypothetical protein [Bacillota bacterium]